MTKTPQPTTQTPIGPYRAYKDLLWAEVRRRYLAGETAPSLCKEYGLSLSTFNSRATREKWRRKDQAEPPLPADPAEAAQVLMNRAVLAASLGETDKAEELAKASRTFRIEAEKRAEPAAEAQRDFDAERAEDREARVALNTKILRFRLHARRENLKLLERDAAAAWEKRQADRAGDAYFWGKVERDPLITVGDEEWEEAERRAAAGVGYVPAPDVEVEW